MKNKPTVFYRGQKTGLSKRIRTGDNVWDSYLFCADNVKSASIYGDTIITITAKADAKILYEGTREYNSIRKNADFPHVPNMRGGLNEWSAIARLAKLKGFDAVWFKRQTDVGTAILNPDVFVFI